MAAFAEDSSGQEKPQSLTDPPPSPLAVIDIALADVDVDTGHSTDPYVVMTLADSIQHTGYLLHPLLVYQQGTRYVLVAGFHRYAALQRLGWTIARASLLTTNDPDKREWAALQENLCRRDVPALELVWSLGKAKELYLKLFPETDKQRNSTRDKNEEEEETHPPFIEYAADLQHRSRSNIGLYLTTYARLDATLYPKLYRIKELVDTITNLSTLATYSKEDQHRIVQDLLGDADYSHLSFRTVVARFTKNAARQIAEAAEQRLADVYARFPPELRGEIYQIPAPALLRCDL